MIYIIIHVDDINRIYKEVLDDDRTGDGDEAEDIYRRSRMNYKEHAKKYFGLAARTFWMS